MIYQNEGEEGRDKNLHVLPSVPEDFPTGEAAASDRNKQSKPETTF